MDEKYQKRDEAEDQYNSDEAVSVQSFITEICGIFCNNTKTDRED